MRIIPLSDLHIGKSKNHTTLKILRDWIIANKDIHKSSVIVITGDIVNDGQLWQYKCARHHITRLRDNGYRVLCCPGNHDLGTLGIVENNDCIRKFGKYISNNADYPHVEIIDNHAFIMLDSMMEEMKQTEFVGAQGELGKQQLNTLNYHLDDIEQNHPEYKVIIGLHHHPFYYNFFLKLRDDELFKKVITDKDSGDSRIDCLLFGHKHDERRFPEKEMKFNISVIYASGSTTERNENGRFVIPVIDLDTNGVERFLV